MYATRILQHESSLLKIVEEGKARVKLGEAREDRRGVVSLIEVG